MFYNEIQPGERVGSFVKCYWVLRQNSADAKGNQETIMPDGCPEIVFNLASSFKRYQLQSVETQPKSILVGQIKQNVLVEPTGQVDLFGVRLFPGGIYPLIKGSVNELTNKIENVETVFGKNGRVLSERINDARSTNERIGIFEQFVTNFYGNGEISPLVENALSVIASTDGRMRIEDVAVSIGANWKTLERHFTKGVGLSPKFYSRIIRLQRVLKLINRRELVDWTDVAYTFGYTDQSHFIKDFRAFAGVAPDEFTRKQNAISDSFVG